MTTFVEGVKRSLAQQHDTMSWRKVTMPGLDVAWAGMNVPTIDTGGRPWVWEFVTPGQWETSERLREDPMVLPVEQDAVVVQVRHADHPGAIVRMQVPVRESVAAIELPIAPVVGPWAVSLEAGWTVQALGSAAQCWIDRETPGGARLETPEPGPAPHPLYKLHPAIDIESAAFDRLLTLGPDEAAVVTSLLTRVHDALDPYR